MPSIDTVVDIAAPPERVWSILAHLGGYAGWNPVLVGVRGWLEPGAPLDLELALGARVVTVGARVLVARPNEELRWRGPRSSILGRAFAGEHYFVLERTGAGTRVRHGEVFSGLLAGAFARAMMPRLEAAYAAMNEGLRRATESPPPAG